MTRRPGIDLLLSLPRFADQGAAAYRPGLERARALLREMDDPQETFKSLHVAGTNGKGSTASMLAAIGNALGYRIGLHTSPHLVDVTERMRVDGVPAPTDWLDEQVSRYRGTIERVQPSFFEAVTAFSFLYFAERSVDWAVVEVGMGGRLDATNVLRSEVTIITRIGLDHTEHLGRTLSAIAREKAGIVKPGRPVVVYPAPPEVVEAISAVSAAIEAPLHLVEDEVVLAEPVTDPSTSQFSVRTPRWQLHGLKVGLPGPHQVENARSAIRAAELAWGQDLRLETAIREGLATVVTRSGLRGRLEVLSTEPLLVADVAHNPDGLSQTLNSLPLVSEANEAHLFVLFALMADKDVPAVVRLLASAAPSVYCVQLDTPRALDANRLAAMLRQANVDVYGVGTLEAGLRATRARLTGPQDIILVTGSHLLVGAFLKLPGAVAV